MSMPDINACMLARFAGPVLPSWLRRWLAAGLVGVALFADNITSPDQLRSLVAQLREHNPDVLIAVDEEGGIVTRVEAAGGSSYPGNAALGAVDDVALTGRVATSTGAMLAAPFHAAIGAGVRSVMTAHVVFPAIDRVPATLSRRISRGVLRDELAFTGVVITDALDMAAIGDGPGSAGRSLQGGSEDGLRR